MLKRQPVDKVAAVCARLRPGPSVVLGEEIPARAGTVVAARVLDAKEEYAELEDIQGRLVRLHPGDVLLGALGHRQATRGYSGRVPEAVRPGDRLQLLNRGGVLGTGAEEVPGLGAPFTLEVLGVVLRFPVAGSRRGLPASIQDVALAPEEPPASWPPATVLLGTSMHAGKTTAAAALVAALRRRGLSVAAGKLTGVASRQDLLQMADAGARPVASFVDFGVVTTCPRSAPGAAASILAFLARQRPGHLVLEMGDGLLGPYGVDAILDDPLFRGLGARLVLCAQDPAGAWGAWTRLREHHGLELHAVTGPLTDSPAGRLYCEEHLGIPARNARREPETLAALLLEESPALLP